VADRELEPIFGTSNFRVLIGRRELGFAEVGPVSSATDLALPPDQRRHRFEAIVLRRALTASTELFDWRRAIIDGKEDRRTVTIHQLDGPGGKIVNSWRLVRAWPSRWSGPAFNALESGVAFEELELAFDDVVWTNRETPTQGE
jgi:T4-like virus tail tube protein gp19